MMNAVTFISFGKNGERTTINTSITNILDKYPEIQSAAWILDPTLEYRFSSIFARDKVILAKIDALRALITKDYLLIPAYCGDEILNHLSFKLSEKTDMPFEFQSLRILLEWTINLFDRSIKFLLANSQLASRIRRRDEYTTLDYDDRMVMEQHTLINLITRVNSINKQLTTVLTEEEFDSFYLTHLRTQHDTSFHDMIEGFQQQFIDQNDLLQDQQDSFNCLMSIVTINLTKKRNYISEVNLSATILMLSITAASLLTGLFGMNLNSGFTESMSAFWVVASIVFIGIFFIAYLFRRYHRL